MRPDPPDPADQPVLFPVFRPASSVGETCALCSQDAWRKVEETIFHDDPHPMRHPLTTYLCLEHFNVLMGQVR